MVVIFKFRNSLYSIEDKRINDRVKNLLKSKQIKIIKTTSKKFKVIAPKLVIKSKPVIIKRKTKKERPEIITARKWNIKGISGVSKINVIRYLQKAGIDDYQTFDIRAYWDKSLSERENLSMIKRKLHPTGRDLYHLNPIV